MTNDEAAAAKAFAENQGAESATVWVIQTGLDEKGAPIYKQVQSIKFKKFDADCYPSQVAAGASIVVVKPVD